MLRRSSDKQKAKNAGAMTPYYFVIGFFVATMAGVVLYVLFDSKQTIKD